MALPRPRNRTPAPRSFHSGRASESSLRNVAVLFTTEPRMPDGGQRCDLHALLPGPPRGCLALQCRRSSSSTTNQSWSGCWGRRSAPPVSRQWALLDKDLGRGIDGVEVLRQLRRRQPRCACIMMTAYPSIGSAVEALRIGAQDYVEKPSPELDTITDRVQSAIRAVRLRDERDGHLVKLTALQQELKDKDSRVRDLEIQLAMAEQVGTGRADEGTEPLLHASRDRDARRVQAAEKLVQMARFLRA